MEQNTNKKILSRRDVNVSTKVVRRLSLIVAEETRCRVVFVARRRPWNPRKIGNQGVEDEERGGISWRKIGRTGSPRSTVTTTLPEGGTTVCSRAKGG